ncbi:MAG TPA: MarR family transcriptional regulator [Ktedonobacteraceae bacterium]|jgi:DNA-binding MarR family transcriptional regulator|nr:MarR family transcriptional regulator [Ktedonobacteraceae bacterium]
MENSVAYLLGRLMFELDRAAEQLLQEHVGISYRRFLFLTVLQHSGTVTQHELAVALGYSDPAVSTMLVELAKDGYIEVVKSPEHARKRLVSITPKGGEVVAQGRKVLDSHFDQLMDMAGVDADHFREQAERLHQALMMKMKKEK